MLWRLNKIKTTPTSKSPVEWPSPHRTTQKKSASEGFYVGAECRNGRQVIWPRQDVHDTEGLREKIKSRPCEQQELQAAIVASALGLLVYAAASYGKGENPPIDIVPLRFQSKELLWSFRYFPTIEYVPGKNTNGQD